MQLAGIIFANALFIIQMANEDGWTLIKTGEAANFVRIPTIRSRVLGREDTADGIRSFAEGRSAH